MLRKLDRPTAVICMIAMLNAMGLGLIMPVMPELLSEFRNGSVADAAAIGGALSLVFAVMQFFFSPLLGALSDRFGRRPVLMGSLALAAADYALMAVAPSLWLFFVGRVLSGASSSTFSVANAYLADRSSGSERSASFGIVGAAAGVGFVMGPFIGGLLGALGPRAPFLAAAVLSLAALLAARTVLTESLTADNRRAISWRTANPLAPLLKRNPGVSMVIYAVFFLDALAGFAFPAVWAYFGAARFGWDSAVIGLSLGIMGVSYAVLQALFVRPLVRRFGNIGAARLALAVGTICFLTLVWLPSGPLALALMPIMTLRAVAGTAIIGETSARIDADRQGELQGIFSSLVALASMVAFPVMTQLFAVQLSSGAGETWRSGTPFLLSAALSAMALALLARGRSRQGSGRLEWSAPRSDFQPATIPPDTRPGPRSEPGRFPTAR